MNPNEKEDDKLRDVKVLEPPLGWGSASRVAQHHPTFFRIKSFKNSIPLVHNGNNIILPHLTEDEVDSNSSVLQIHRAEQKTTPRRRQNGERQVGYILKGAKERRVRAEERGTTSERGFFM